MIDPNTGLPVAPEWKDSDWNDPDITLTNVDFVGLPVSEVARELSEQFSNEFDILLPQDFGAGRPGGDNNPDWLSTTVHLKLHDVHASEVFSAMNLLFTDDRIPMRWELKMNGKRRIVLLRVLEDPKGMDLPDKPRSKHVFFVGDLIGDTNSGAMTMPEVVDTVQSVWRMAYGNNGAIPIQFHERAQIIIVTGSDDEIAFVQQTLQAMAQKLSIEQQKAGLKSAKEMPKPESGAGGP
jgi:hypothetical protein